MQWANYADTVRPFLTRFIISSDFYIALFG